MLKHKLQIKVRCCTSEISQSGKLILFSKSPKNNFQELQQKNKFQKTVGSNVRAKKIFFCVSKKIWEGFLNYYKQWPYAVETFKSVVDFQENAMETCTLIQFQKINYFLKGDKYFAEISFLPSINHHIDWNSMSLFDLEK